MKKRLALLPLVAFMSLGLASCGDDDEGDNGLQGLLDEQPGPKEYEGYRRVAVPQNGKKYLLGMYDEEEDVMRFINGDQHHDNDPKYASVNYSFPYYLETVEDVEDAAEVKVEYLDDTHFTIQVFAQDEDYYYNEYFLHVYTDTASSNRPVVSLERVEEVDDDMGKFEVIKEVNEDVFVGIGIMFQDDRLDEDEEGENPKLLGTAASYTSLQIEQQTKVAPGTYYAAHFWEKI